MSEIKKDLPEEGKSTLLTVSYGYAARPTLSCKDMVMMVLVVDVPVHTETNVAINHEYPNFSAPILQIPKRDVSLQS